MVFGFSPVGALGHVVRVEVDVRQGLPGTDIVGLPSSEVREARDRVRVAVRNSGYEYPLQRILVSLSPAELPKVGSGFDLPIALAILERSGQLTLPGDVLASGELSVRGEVVPVRGTLSAVLAAVDHGIPSVVLGTRGVSVLGRHRPSDATVLATPSLRELRKHGFSRDMVVPMATGGPSRSTTFDDVVGQPALKWAATVAAAGFHNLLLMGPPGSGKTMAAQRLRSLLPDLPSDESREVARVYSMRGLEASLQFPRPPVRMPHHSASVEGMMGGGKGSVPGEVSLAHRGVLVLDEAPEFRPRVLQSLREPVEHRAVTISRAGRSEVYPAEFQLVLTSNLCPCGKLGQPGARCLCSIQEIERYWRRVGAALLDRIDLRVRTYYQRDPASTPAHRELESRVRTAVARQVGRYDGLPWQRNGLVPPEAAAGYLGLSPTLERVLRRRMQQLRMSDRAAAAVRAVARTLADLDDRDEVTARDILEAAALRRPGPV